jgi:hypothetical protein
VRVFGEPIRSLWPAANWFKFCARGLPPSWPRCGSMSQKRIVVVHCLLRLSSPPRHQILIQIVALFSSRLSRYRIVKIGK